MKILFFSIYPSLHRRRTVSGFKPVLCSRRTAVRQHQNNSQPLTFLSFDLFEKVFRTLRSTTKGVASGHHHLLKKVDENFCLLPKNSAKRALFFWFNLSFRKGRISEVHQWWRQNCLLSQGHREANSFLLV